MNSTRRLPCPANGVAALTVVFFIANLTLGDLAMGQQADVSDLSPGNATLVVEAQASLIQNTTIAAPISGVMIDVAVKEGDRVAAGMMLARFDDDEAKAEVAAAESSFEAARIESLNDVDARYAERSREVNLRELTQSEKANQDYAGAISGTEIERLRMVVDQATLAIEQALHDQNVAEARAKEKEAAMQVAMTRWSKHRLKALVDGMVAEVNVQKGQWIDQGKPMLRLISLDPIRVECFVDGRQFGEELVGATVRFEPDVKSDANEADSTGPRYLTGEVTFVSPELHPVTGQARLWAELANPQRWVRAGMRGQLIVGAIDTPAADIDDFGDDTRPEELPAPQSSSDDDR